MLRKYKPIVQPIIASAAKIRPDAAHKANDNDSRNESNKNHAWHNITWKNAKYEVSA